MRAKILNASAGSGKTYQLAYKYVCDVIEEPERYRHILAVTFTNKATEEMKSRILERIHELASESTSPYLTDLCNELKLDAQEVRTRARSVQSKILHDYSHFTVLTIDKFFQRILRAFIRELGIAPDYNTEIETESIVGRSADTLIEQITTDNELRHWLMEFVQERIDEGRRWDIREGILSLSGELFKEQNRASLGMTRSKEELGKLVGKAAGEAKETQEQMQQTARQAIALIAEAGLSLNDFPYKGAGFANYFYKTAQGTIEAYGSRVHDACASEKSWSGAAKTMQGALQPLLQRMCVIYDQNIRAWNTAALLRENFRSFALLADLYTKVQQMCDQENMMLLSETKYILSEFIGHNDAPFIYEKAGTRFDRFMIDEFQDTSAREWENFLPLLQNAMSQSEKTSVLLVGDIKQSIYRWRGGDWRILHTEAQQALGAESTEVVNLKENFRSLSAVVDFNNRIIGQVIATDNARLNAELTEAAQKGGLPQGIKNTLTDTLKSAYNNHEQIAARRSDRTGYVRVATFDEEPPLIANIKEILDRGFRPKDILILVRTNSEGVQIAEKLLDFKRQNDDPHYRFDVMTQEALVVGNAPVCAFIAATMRLSLNPDDTMSRAVYNGYLGGRAFNAPLTDEERLFCRSVRLRSLEEAFEQIVMRHKLQERQGEIAYLQAIHEAVIQFCTRKVADIPLFLKWWDETGSGQSLSVEQSEATIGIMTIHKAKGLQNKVVFIPYCSWALAPEAAKQPVIWGEAANADMGEIGRFPVRYKKNMAESHFSAEYYRELVYTHVDNINLLYVALTRAEEALYLFIPQQTRNRNHAGALVLEGIAADGTVGLHTATDEGDIYEFGEATGPAAQHKSDKQAEHTVLGRYVTAEADLRLRLPSQRYFEEGAEAELAPRNFGILMHKAFENAATEADILGAIDAMRADALISEAEAASLHRATAKALADATAREWFDGAWDRVRNEHEIIVPHDSGTRRPDRVMIRGQRAVVVDYKFGEREPEKYRRQIREYADLLRQIGYTETEGYLWFVKLGNIERVV